MMIARTASSTINRMSTPEKTITVGASLITSPGSTARNSGNSMFGS